MDDLRAAKRPLGLPEIRGGEYLVACLAEEDGLGWCGFDSMGGMAPHTWAEIDAYSRVAGFDLDPWEARQLRAMSAAYVAGQIEGRKKTGVAPTFTGGEVERKRELARGIRAQLRLARAQG
ncbi:hypothetical protein ORIO_12570 [Cereibacter azotoformans]|uniref:hypothetical protein n=1 Tax=Cereibacter azotoformans TaxID=43057 RepID=UPI001EEBD18C|nr:hypothetical protein [Cereibacter azotoformans]ULB10737.1 hypothetical protein ORIO_12570 [Cereibacter azotoformans]